MRPITSDSIEIVFCAQREDIVWAESCSLQTVHNFHPLWTELPQMHAWSVLLYKVGLAAGDFKKPVLWIAVGESSVMLMTPPCFIPIETTSKGTGGGVP